MTSCPGCGQNVPDGAKFCGACGSKTSNPEEQNGLVGKIVANRYRVLRVIAEGGMGVVYEAEQAMGEGVRKVAIKTLLPDLSRDPVVVSRFNRECSVVAGLEHPNTVRVYDFGATDDGALYIAMEFVRGRPLGDVIAEGPMPLQRCLGIMAQICSALEEAHDQGVVHRDLKPDNLVLCDRAGIHDVVKVLDFGIAKRSSEGGKHDTKLTQQGMVLGTPPYMSPEQFTGETLTRTSDIYSLSIIFYEMVNARLPFEGDTPWQWAHQHMSVAPAPFTVAVPAALAEVVFAALSKKPSLRPPTTVEFHRRLVAACGRSPDERSRLIPPTSKVPLPDARPLDVVRTEPSILRQSAEPNTLDDVSDLGVAGIDAATTFGGNPSVLTRPPGDTAPASPVHLHAVELESSLHTEPAARAVAGYVSAIATSAALQPPVLQRKPVQRKSRMFVLLLLGGAAIVGTIAAAWWFNATRSSGDKPPMPTVALAESTAEIAAEASSSEFASEIAAPQLVSPRPAAPKTNARPNAGTALPAPSSAPAQSNNPPPAPVPTAQSPGPSFPFPFPLALPSLLTPAGNPPTVPAPAPAPPAPPTTLAQPPPASPPVSSPAAGMQSCVQASALAVTDLDAAVGQYQICEGAVGRNAAGAARSQIASIGTARAKALAAQGNCAEAQRVVQTLARIGVHRTASDAVKRAGCST